MAFLNVRNTWSLTGFFLYSDSWIVTTKEPGMSVDLSLRGLTGTGVAWAHQGWRWVFQSSPRRGDIPTGNNHQLPLLNQLAALPMVGSIAGALRIALACLHIAVHFLMTLARGLSRDHATHVIKGSAELVRGIIELLPIIGTLFTRWFDVRDEQRYLDHHARCQVIQHHIHYSFFLVKAYHWDLQSSVDKPDMIGYKTDAYYPQEWRLNLPALPMRFREPCL